MTVVLACDLGGTSFRAALIDAEGDIRAETSTAGPFPDESNGRSEIDANAWWQAFCNTASRLAQEAPADFARIAAVTICGVTRTQVFVDTQGHPVRSAITWKDTRAQGIAERLASTVDHPESSALNGYHPLARLAWLRESEPDVAARVAKVLDPKDYLNLCLTGRAASDPVSMARLIAANAAPSLLGKVGFATSVIPDLRDPWASVGDVLPDLPGPLTALAGCPVFCGSNDTWVGVVGLGAMRPGLAYNISGTTEVLGVMGERAIAAEGLLTVDWLGQFQLGGPSQNGADTVAWLMSLLGADGSSADVGKTLDTLVAGPRHSQPVLFLPYLQGERVPYWNPSLRGAFVGLNRQHGAGDLAWAVLEGVAFLNRIVLEAAETAIGASVAEIRFGGGAARNGMWRQIKADVTGRPIVVGEAQEPGLLGAAIVAWTGLGQFASLSKAQEKLVRIATRTLPDPARNACYNALFPLFRQAEAALAPVSRALSSFALGGF